MLEILITISVVGLIAGIIFSVPVAGPISIFIASHGLNGRLRYCVMAAVGASIVDFIYCFISVFCFTQLYALYQPIINFIFLLGSIFLLIMGYKIMRTKLELPEAEGGVAIPKKTKEKSGFRIGFMLNLLNPSLFVGWLFSSLLIMSVVSSMGFNTGGLDSILDNNVKAINHTHQIQKKGSQEKKTELKLAAAPAQKSAVVETGKKPKGFFDFSLLISFCYAFFVALGTIIWFYFFSFLIVKYRKLLKADTIKRLIQSLGFTLLCFGLFLSYRAIIAFVG